MRQLLRYTQRSCHEDVPRRQRCYLGNRGTGRFADQEKMPGSSFDFYAKEYDYTVVNDTVLETVNQIVSIMEAEKFRSKRMLPVIDDILTTKETK